jgi:hypothetical protein
MRTGSPAAATKRKVRAAESPAAPVIKIDRRPTRSGQPLRRRASASAGCGSREPSRWAPLSRGPWAVIVIDIDSRNYLRSQWLRRLGFLSTAGLPPPRCRQQAARYWMPCHGLICWEAVAAHRPAQGIWKSRSESGRAEADGYDSPAGDWVGRKRREGRQQQQLIWIDCPLGQLR